MEVVLEQVVMKGAEISNNSRLHLG